MIPAFSWKEIETVFLDMDGVLLDRHFDDWFWSELVPRRFTEKHGGTTVTAQKRLFAAYKEVEHTLAWYDLDYWSEQLQLDIPALKREGRERIALRPGAIDFLRCMKERDIPVSLVTNAHPKTLAVKLKKYDLAPWLQQIVSTHTIGIAKENARFWSVLQDHVPYRRKKTFFADDTEQVLFAARQQGPEHLLHIAKPSSALAAVFSRHFPSTSYLADAIR